QWDGPARRLRAESDSPTPACRFSPGSPVCSSSRSEALDCADGAGRRNRPDVFQIVTASREAVTHYLARRVLMQLAPGGIIAWIIVGLIAGWAASSVSRGHGFGIIGDI